MGLLRLHHDVPARRVPGRPGPRRHLRRRLLPGDRERPRGECRLHRLGGWVHLLLGALLLVCAGGVLTGNVAARTVAVILAGLSAVLNLLFIEAYPLWSMIVISIDVLVIYALTVLGRELRTSTR